MTPDGQKRYYEFLQELNKKVQDLIEFTRPITTGALNLNGSWPVKDQYKHILEEVMEAFAEYQLGKSPDDEVEEDLDILMTVLTLLHIKGYSPMDKKFAIGRLQKKYHERGFLNFE